MVLHTCAGSVPCSRAFAFASPRPGRQPYPRSKATAQESSAASTCCRSSGHKRGRRDRSDPSPPSPSPLDGRIQPIRQLPARRRFATTSPAVAASRHAGTTDDRIACPAHRCRGARALKTTSPGGTHGQRGGIKVTLLPLGKRVIYHSALGQAADPRGRSRTRTGTLSR